MQVQRRFEQLWLALPEVSGERGNAESGSQHVNEAESIKPSESWSWRGLGRLEPCTDGLALCEFANISAMCGSWEKKGLQFEGLFREQDGVPGQDKWTVSPKVKGHLLV